MPGLQTAYYIIAIVFMGVIFLLLLIGVIAVLRIRAKINAIHARIEERIELVTDLATTGGAVLGTLKKVAGKQKR